MKKTVIFAALVIAGLIILLFINKNGMLKINNNYLTKNTSPYDPVDYSPEELELLLKEQNGKYVIIDVRSQLEYNKGHVPGSVHADYFDIDALKKAAGDKIPITYCAFGSMRGPYAAYELYKAGYKNASVLSGGLSAWTENIQKLESKDPAIKTVFNHPKNIFPVRDNTSYPADRGQVELSIIAKKFEFIPNQITVKHGQKVILHIKSIDVIHGFALPEFGIEEELLPNEQKDINFIAGRKGNFSFVCNVICGHGHSSMVGNIIIE